MDFVLVLILAFLSTGKSYNTVTEQKWNACYEHACYERCPAGCYNVGRCDDDPVKKYRCKECNMKSFTTEANTVTECERCSRCRDYEKTTKNCTRKSDVVCDCKEGYYRNNSSLCLKCKCKDSEYKNKYPDYRRKCAACPGCSTNSPTPASTSPATRTTDSKNSSTPLMKALPRDMNAMSWLFLVVVLVTLLLFLWLLLLFARSLFKYRDSCLRCSVKKCSELSLEAPDDSEQGSHQGSSPHTLILKISENTPMMTPSQNSAMPEHLTHISPPDDELKGDASTTALMLP